MLFDLHVTLVYQPMLLYPTPVICTIGVARHLPTFYDTVFQLVKHFPIRPVKYR